MDWNYSTETKDVYHVLLSCPDSKDIKRENFELNEPPAEDGRRLCAKCLQIISNWLATL